MKEKLKKLFTRKIKVSFLMKSGAVLTVKARTIEIQRNGNELMGYKMEGIRDGQPFYLNIDEIAAITYK